jgi:nucleotide-binding universal stress UspA family protein
MERLLRSLRARDVSVCGMIEPGPVAEAIVRRAVCDQHDLIVMGRRRQTGLATAAWGSITTWVLANAPCPVLSYQLREMEAIAA